MPRKFLTALIVSVLSVPTALPQPAFAADFEFLGLTVSWDEGTFYQPSGCTYYTFSFRKTQKISAMLRIDNRYGDILGAEPIYSDEDSGKKSIMICSGKDFTDTKLVLDVRSPQSDIKSIPILFKVRGASPAQTAPTTAPTTPNSIENETCSKGGDCKVGDIGPGGGVIVYVSPSIQIWGRYIEAAPKGWYLGRLDPQKKPFCPDRSSNGADFVNTKSQIGSGLSNSIAIRRLCPNGGAVADAMAYQGNGLNDWFLPSMDELNELYYSRTKIGLEDSWYWSSTTSQYYQITSLYVPFGRLEGNSSATNDHKIRPVRYGFTKADLEAKAKAEAKAAAELKAAADAEAKAAADAEAKAAADAEAKAAADAEAKASSVVTIAGSGAAAGLGTNAVKKKTTIACVKGKLTKKVTAVNPKCPAGYKKK